jgi:hypothetical protein
MTTIILADTMRDAATYANATGMKRGAWIFPARGETISGVVPKTVVTLPSYAHRRDRHNVTAILRRQVRKGRAVEHVNVSQARFDAMRESTALAGFFDGAADEGVVLDG